MMHAIVMGTANRCPMFCQAQQRSNFTKDMVDVSGPPLASIHAAELVFGLRPPGGFKLSVLAQFCGAPD
jgi:hypothetical protein